MQNSILRVVLLSLWYIVLWQTGLHAQLPFRSYLNPASVGTSLGTYNSTNNAILNLTTMTLTDGGANTYRGTLYTHPVNGGRYILFTFTAFTLNASHTISYTGSTSANGSTGTVGVIILSRGAMTISGVIEFSAFSAIGGPGATNGAGACSGALAPGGLAGGSWCNGAGAFGGLGGGSSTDLIGAFGGLDMILTGGMGGGGFGAGGGGGGIQLSAAGTLTLNATARINANGANGTAPGSGGGILLTGQSISFNSSAQLNANGGSSSGATNGGGGGGRVLFTAVGGSVTGTPTISVAGGAGTGGFLNGTVGTSGGVPTITAITPTSGDIGGTVTITGTNLGSINDVRFFGSSGVQAVVQSSSATSLVAVIPAGSSNSGQIFLSNNFGTVLSPTFVFNTLPTSATVSATALNFGSVTSGMTDATTQTVVVTIRNASAGERWTYTLTGTHASEFSLSGNTGFTTSASSSVFTTTVTVSFDPTTTVGSRTANLIISTASSISTPTNVALSGTSIPPTSATVSATALNFGVVENQTTTQTVVITIRNARSGERWTYSLTGTNASEFSLSGNTGFTTTASSSVFSTTVTISFNPSATTGVRTANLVISTESSISTPTTIVLTSQTLVPVSTGFGSAVRFFGSNLGSVIIPHIAQYNFTTDCTIEARIRVNSWGSDDTEIISKGNDRFFMRFSANLGLVIRSGSGYYSSPLYKDNFDRLFELGRWYHIAVTYDAYWGRVRVFVDGVFLASFPSDGSGWGSNIEPILVGRSRIYPSYIYSLVDIDEVRVWNKVMYEQNKFPKYVNTEIPSNHPDRANLVGYWKMNEGNGITTADESGNSNNGTFAGNVQWSSGDTAMTFWVSPFRATSFALPGLPTGGTFALIGANGGSTRATVTLNGGTVTYTPTIPIIDVQAQDSIRYTYTLPSGRAATGFCAILFTVAVRDTNAVLDKMITGRIDNVLGGISPYNVTTATRPTDRSLFSYQWNPTQGILSSSSGATFAAFNTSTSLTLTVTDDIDSSTETLNISAVTFPHAGHAKALRFNGTSGRAVAGNISQANFTNRSPFTIEALVRLRNVTGGVRTIVSRYSTGTADNESWSLGVDASGFPFLKRDGNTAGSALQVTATGNLTLNANEWVHLAGRYDGTNLQLYQDGVLIRTVASTTNLSANSASVVVGAEFGNGSFANFFDGDIDEVRIWNTALSQQRINEYRRRTVPSSHPDVSSLLAYWSMDDITGPGVFGTTIADASGNNRPLTLSNIVQQVYSPNSMTAYVSPRAATAIPLQGFPVGQTFALVGANGGAVRGTVTLSGGVATYTPSTTITVVNQTDSFTYTYSDGVRTSTGSVAILYTLDMTTASVQVGQGIATAIGSGVTTFGGTGNRTFLWSPATGLNVNNVASPIATLSSSTTYTVTITDERGFTTSGTVQVNPIIFARAGFGYAVNFDGVTSFGTLGDISAMQFAGNQPFTIEARIRPRTQTSSASRVILSKYRAGATPDANAGFSLGVTPSGRGFITRVANGGNEVATLEGALLTGNQWVHLSAQYDGSRLTLMQNGAIVSSATVTGAMSSSNIFPVLVGADQDGAGQPARFFDGDVDEIRVWNMAVPQNALAHFQGIEIPNDHPLRSSLIGYWKLNDVGTTSGADETAGNNTIQFTNAGWIINQDPQSIVASRGIATQATINGVPTSTPMSLVGTNGGAQRGTASLAGRVLTYTGTTQALPQGASDAMTVQMQDANSTTQGTVAVRFRPILSSQATTASIGVATPLGGTYSIQAGTPPYSYQWSPAQGLSATNTATPLVTTDANITYTLTVSDAFGERASTTVSVQVFETPQAGFARAVNFNGSSAVGVVGGNTSDLNFANRQAFTVEALIRVRTQTSAQQRTILSKYQTTSGVAGAQSAWSLAVNSAGRLVAVRAGNNGADVQSVQSTALLTQGIWVHVAMQYDGTTLRLYQDGVLQGSITATGNIPNSTAPLLIGAETADNGSPRFFFDGDIEEVRAWNTALTQRRISEYRGREIPADHPQRTNLVGYWQCNAPNRATLADASGNNRVATLSGGYSWIGGNAPLSMIASQQGASSFALSGFPAGLQYSITAQPTRGTATLQGTTLTYTPTGTIATNDTDSFTYQVSDGVRPVSTASVTIRYAPRATGATVAVVRNTLTPMTNAQTVIGGLSPYQYDWSPAAGLSASTIATPSVIFNYDPAMPSTSYTVTITDALGYSTVATVPVVLAPTVLASQVNTTPYTLQNSANFGAVFVGNTSTQTVTLTIVNTTAPTTLTPTSALITATPSTLPAQSGVLTTTITIEFTPTALVTLSNVSLSIASSGAPTTTLTLSGRSIIGAPIIAGIQPAIVTAGSVVSVLGSNLNQVTSVSFGGTGWSIVSATPTQLQLQVPALTLTTTQILTLNSTFGSTSTTLTILSAPRATIVLPASTNAGTTLTVVGANLNTLQMAVLEPLAGNISSTTALPIVSSSATQLVMSIPASIGGNFTLRLTNQAGGIVQALRVVGIAQITSITPNPVLAGTTIAIVGVNLDGLATMQLSTTPPTNLVAQSSTATQIITMIPAGISQSLTLTLTNSASSTSQALTVFSPPVITGITPTSAAGGDQITITGQNLNQLSAIRFFSESASSATVVSSSATAVVVIVPSGLTQRTGSVRVENFAGFATSTAFSFIFPPSITDVAPRITAPGQTITITGVDLLSVSAVRFFGANGTRGTIQSNDGNSLVVVVPNNVTPREGAVFIESRIGSATTTQTIVVSGPPVVSAITPNVGIMGNVVTLSGANLETLTAVRFFGENGTPAFITASSATTAILTIPQVTATFGSISVSNLFGSSTGPSFRIIQPPSVTGLSAVVLPRTGSLTILGDNLAEVTEVRAFNFDGVLLPILSSSATQIVVSFPAGLPSLSGQLFLRNTAGNTRTPTITLIEPPSIASIAPQPINAGSNLTISGSNLDRLTSAVVFGSTGAIVSSSATQIVMTIPNTSTSSGSLVLQNIAGTTTQIVRVVNMPRITAVQFTNTNGTLTTASDGIATVPQASSMRMIGTDLDRLRAVVLQTPTLDEVLTVSNATFTTIDVNFAPRSVFRQGRIFAQNEVGNTLSTVQVAVVPPPVITAMTPLVVVTGGTITLTGTNFATMRTVQIFGQTNANFRVVSDQSLVVTIPAGLTRDRGRLALTNIGGTTMSDSLSVLPPVTILSLSTTATANQQDRIVLRGRLFETVTAVSLSIEPLFPRLSGTSTATIQPIAFNYVGGDSIAINIPTQQFPSRVRCIVSNPAGSATSAPITVNTPPTIIRTAPASIVMGDTLTIVGANLGGMTGLRAGDDANAPLGRVVSVQGDSLVRVLTPQGIAGFGDNTVSLNVRFTVVHPGGNVQLTPLRVFNQPLVRGMSADNMIAPNNTMIVFGRNLEYLDDIILFTRTGQSARIVDRPNRDTILILTPTPLTNTVTQGRFYAVSSRAGMIDSNQIITRAVVPVFTSVTPAVVTEGDTVTIRGTGMGLIDDAFLFSLTGPPMRILRGNRTPTQVQVVVPPNVGSRVGPIAFNTALGAVTTQSIRIVATPIALNLQPFDGIPGDTILILGANLRDVNEVRFYGANGIRASILNTSARTDEILPVVVPLGIGMQEGTIWLRNDRVITQVGRTFIRRSDPPTPPGIIGVDVQGRSATVRFSYGGTGIPQRFQLRTVPASIVDTVTYDPNRREYSYSFNNLIPQTPHRVEIRSLSVFGASAWASRDFTTPVDNTSNFLRPPEIVSIVDVGSSQWIETSTATASARFGLSRDNHRISGLNLVTHDLQFTPSRDGRTPSRYRLRVILDSSGTVSLNKRLPIAGEDYSTLDQYTRQYLWYDSPEFSSADRKYLIETAFYRRYNLGRRYSLNGGPVMSIEERERQNPRHDSRLYSAVERTWLNYFRNTVICNLCDMDKGWNVPFPVDYYMFPAFRKVGDSNSFFRIGAWVDSYLRGVIIPKATILVDRELTSAEIRSQIVRISRIGTLRPLLRFDLKTRRATDRNIPIYTIQQFNDARTIDDFYADDRFDIEVGDMPSFSDAMINVARTRIELTAIDSVNGQEIRATNIFQLESKSVVSQPPQMPGTPTVIERRANALVLSFSDAQGRPPTYVVRTFDQNNTLVRTDEYPRDAILSTQVVGNLEVLTDGLRQATNYTFRVSAKNAIGESNQVSSAPAQTLSNLPGAPSLLTARREGLNAGRLNWVQLTGSGAKVNRYQVQLIASNQDFTANTPTIDVPNSIPTIAVPNLLLSVPYKYRVRGVNDAGVSDWAVSSDFILVDQRQRDSLTLVQFYRSTNGANWTNNAGWLTEQPLERWAGITIRNDRVSEIVLPSNNIIGALRFDSLTTLSNLRVLSVWNNNLTLQGNTTTAPTDITGLGQLEFAELYNTRTIGFVNWLTAGRLRVLRLANTQVGRTFSSGIFANNSAVQTLLLMAHLNANLEILDLRNARFTASGLAQVNNLSKLTGLWLSNNSLSGTMNFSPSSLRQLTSVFMQSNSFTDVADFTPIRSQLRHLHVQNNRIPTTGLSRNNILLQDTGTITYQFLPQSVTAQNTNQAWWQEGEGVIAGKPIDGSGGLTGIFTLRTYPQPVNDELMVEVYAPETAQITLVISDKTGRTVHTQTIGVLAGQTLTLPIAVRQWASGTYTLVARIPLSTGLVSEMQPITIAR